MMKKLAYYFVYLVCYVAFCNCSYAAIIDTSKHPFYVGLTGGYGQTTWEGLVPPESKQNIAMALSTPTYVSEGGVAWGLFAGYELIPYFAIEAAYTHYPNAKVSFDSSSIFTFENDNASYFITKTESISLMGKIMMYIPHTSFRAYSSLGLAEVHRSDILNNHWVGSPTFGAGLNYNITEHIMAELGGSYTAGKGQSELNPINNYFPFLYTLFLGIAYRF